MSSIPKVIHYCWFGGKPLPEEYRRYIDSWKKYLPDYEIKEWNESNFDFSACRYSQQAYDEKRWAFVSDYARFWILYNYGGLYFDTDVEMVKSLDSIVEKGSFMGIEKIGVEEPRIGVAPGLGLGTLPGHNLYKEILDLYNSIDFVDKNGILNTRTVVEYVTEILTKYGFKEKDELQSICGISLYPSEYFDPIDSETGKLTMTANTVTIHHYSCSWADKNIQRKKRLQAMLGPNVTSMVINFKRKIKGILK